MVNKFYGNSEYSNIQPVRQIDVVSIHSFLFFVKNLSLDCSNSILCIVPIKNGNSVFERSPLISHCCRILKKEKEEPSHYDKGRLSQPTPVNEDSQFSPEIKNKSYFSLQSNSNRQL